MADERDASTGEEDDFLTSDAGTDGGGGRGGGAGDRLYGNLKTTLTWLPGGSGVPIVGVRQLLSGGRGVEIKYKGALGPAPSGGGSSNAGSNGAAANYRFQLRRPFYTNLPSAARVVAAERGVRLKGEPAVKNPRALLPGGLAALLWRDWSVAPGVALTDSSERPFDYTLTLRKQPQVLKRAPGFNSWLSAKATLEIDAATQAARARGNARLKLFRSRATSSQDLGISLGWDWALGSSGVGDFGSIVGGGVGGVSVAGDVVSIGGGGGGPGGLKFAKVPYIKIAENDWAVRWRGGRVSFTYTV